MIANKIASHILDTCTSEVQGLFRYINRRLRWLDKTARTSSTK